MALALDIASETAEEGKDATEAEAMSKVWFITGAGSGIGDGTAKAALTARPRARPKRCGRRITARSRVIRPSWATRSWMATPPQAFVAGSDALAAVTPVVEGRLKAMRAHETLSRSTDGSF
jgi:hypothetical protein